MERFLTPGRLPSGHRERLAAAQTNPLLKGKLIVSDSPVPPVIGPAVCACAVTAPSSPLAGFVDGAPAELAGMAAVVIDHTTKQGRPWATVVLETPEGDVTVLVFPNAYETLARRALRAGTRWNITGRVDLRADGPRLVALTIERMEQ